MPERQIRIATVLVSLLAVLLLVNTYWKPSDPVEDDEATAAVWTIARDAIVRIEAQRPDDVLILAKRDDGWFIEAPFQDRATTRQVDYLLDELERVKKGVPIPGADPAEFGLGEPPTVRITTTLADGTEQVLDVGGQSPVGWRTYVRGVDEPVVAVSGIVGERFQMDPEKLRDLSVVRFAPSTVRRVTIDSAEGSLSVHGEGSRWWVLGWTRADPDRIDDLVVGLQSLRFDAFLGHDPAVEGIADPRFAVAIETTDGQVGFEVGALGPEGALVRAADGRAGWIDPDRLSLLGQGPKDIGDPRAFPIDPQADDAVSVQLGEARWSATREPGAWRSDTLDADAAAAAIEALQEVPIRYQREPAPELEAVWGRVEVRRGDALPRVVELGQIVEEVYRTAKDLDGGAPYRVPIASLEAVALRP